MLSPACTTESFVWLQSECQSENTGPSLVRESCLQCDNDVKVYQVSVVVSSVPVTCADVGLYVRYELEKLEIILSQSQDKLISVCCMCGV